MASSTVSAFTDVYKEAWTQDRLAKQFYDENPLLERAEKFSTTVIGKQAQVPIHKGRAGGYSVKSSAGGTLNNADYQKVDQAAYTLSYPYQQVSIETGALNQGTGGNQSVVAQLDLEIEGAINDMKKQAMRQVVGNGDALIAEFTTTTATTPLNLKTPANGGKGYDAIVRGWLVPGQQVDIGTTANEVSVADGYFVTAVSEDETTPTVTVSTTYGGSAASLTTAAGDYISIKDARAATTSNETNGLRNIVSATGALGGLNPATTGEEFWKAAYVDTTTTVLSLDLLMTLRRKVHQKTGTDTGKLWLMSIKQYSVLEQILQNQVRFTNPDSLKAGNASLSWAGGEILQYPDLLDSDVYCITESDLIHITGDRIKKPTWMSDIQGTNTGLIWAQGATNFVDAITYPQQFGVSRRNSHAAAKGLTAA